MELGGVALPTGVQKLCHFVAELEGCTLKAHIGSRADFKDEAKVNVHQPALSVYEDVAIMAILGLQQIAGNSIPAAPENCTIQLRCQKHSRYTWAGCVDLMTTCSVCTLAPAA